MTIWPKTLRSSHRCQKQRKHALYPCPCLRLLPCVSLSLFLCLAIHWWYITAIWNIHLATFVAAHFKCGTQTRRGCGTMVARPQAGAGHGRADGTMTDSVSDLYIWNACCSAHCNRAGCHAQNGRERADASLQFSNWQAIKCYLCNMARGRKGEREIVCVGAVVRIVACDIRIGT